MRAASSYLGGHDCDHRVEFYESDATLVETVAGFAVPALSAGEAVVVIATSAHRRAFADAIRGAGADLEIATAEGRYQELDAADLLESFLADGEPDPERFGRTVGRMLERVAAKGTKVNVFGEMVALLWERGEVAALIALENLWNELAEDHSFSLLCGYPLNSFEDDPGSAFQRICECHDSVRPAQLGKLARLAHQDPLTGVDNRRSFDLHLEREWQLAHRELADGFVVMADIDGLKKLNDEQGHAAGDRALRAFASTLRRTARATDLVGRLGGDEFGVILPRCDEAAARSFAERLQTAFSEELGDPCGAGVGWASLLAAPSPAEALTAADAAMLAAKRVTR